VFEPPDVYRFSLNHLGTRFKFLVCAKLRLLPLEFASRGFLQKETQVSHHALPDEVYLHSSRRYQCRYLLKQRNTILVFPEGQRSRKGHFDAENMTLGAGRLVASFNNARVLCLYLRSPKQETFSNYPPAGSHFTLSMKLIEPHSDRQGKEAAIDITQQISNTIQSLEADFFSANKIDV
jgi:hypothetical protein